jgi:hypothetical protein
MNPNVTECIAQSGNATPVLTPFKPVRFTPVYASNNDDGSLGADGSALGTAYLDGTQLHVQGTFAFAGAGAAPGTGGLILPLPPGVTFDMVDFQRMQLEGSDPGPPVVDAVIGTVIVQGTIDSPVESLCLASAFELEYSDGVFVECNWDIARLADIVDGNAISFSYEIPLR